MKEFIHLRKAKKIQEAIILKWWQAYLENGYAHEFGFSWIFGLFFENTYAQVKNAPAAGAKDPAVYARKQFWPTKSTEPFYIRHNLYLSIVEFRPRFLCNDFNLDFLNPDKTSRNVLHGTTYQPTKAKCPLSLG